MLNENEHAKTCIAIVHLHAGHHLHSHQYICILENNCQYKKSPHSHIQPFIIGYVCIQSDKETHAQLGVWMCDRLTREKQTNTPQRKIENSESFL